jgi:small multidrug resistance family-3 protein
MEGGMVFGDHVLVGVGLFVVAGFAEIGRGWLMWQWLCVDGAWSFGIAGALTLVLCGVILTLQAEPAFGRVYAAYGGIFVVLSIICGRTIDGWRPDRWDLLGAVLCVAGGVIMVGFPRGVNSRRTLSRRQPQRSS